MVDQQLPTTQFHPYQPPDATPHSEKVTGGLGGLLSKVGLSQASLEKITGPMKNLNTGRMSESIRNVNVQQHVGKAREYAAANPGKVLGGLAALVIGAGLMRQRSMRSRVV